MAESYENDFENLFDRSIRTLEVYGIVSSFLLIAAFNSISTAVKLANNSQDLTAYNVTPIDGIIFVITVPLIFLGINSLLCYLGKENFFEDSLRMLRISRVIFGACLIGIIIAIIATGTGLFSTTNQWMTHLR